MSVRISKPTKALLIGLLVPLAVTLSGCLSECTDRADCASKNTATTTYACVDNKCVAESTDSGILDGGQDAGQQDAGSTDAGTTDGGPFVHFVATLKANQEVPASDSTGTGSGFIDLFAIDAGSYPIHYHLEWTGVTATLAHVHQNPGANTGPIIPNLNFSAGGAPTSPIDGTTTLNSDERDALDRGLFYFNVHDSAHPAGAIRGQILKSGETLYTVRFTDVDGGGQVVVQPDGGAKVDGLWDTTPGPAICGILSFPTPSTLFCGPTDNNGFGVTANLSQNLTGFDTAVNAGYITVQVRDAADAGLFSGTVHKK